MQKTQLQISRWLEIEELTVGFVESATGGLISSI
jgi:nicotinamide mononucleotide (NMN) deamidase PncC